MDTRSLYDYYRVISIQLSGSWATDLDGKLPALGRRKTKGDRKRREGVEGDRGEKRVGRGGSGGERTLFLWQVLLDC